LTPTLTRTFDWGASVTPAGSFLVICACTPPFATAAEEIEMSTAVCGDWAKAPAAVVLETISK
jgi:hypothetical protein